MGIQVHDWSDHQPHIKAYREKAKKMNETRIRKNTSTHENDNQRDYDSELPLSQPTSLPTLPNAMQGNARQNKALIRDDFDSLERSEFAEKIVTKFCREIGTNGSRRVAVAAVVKLFDDYPRRTAADVEAAVESYRVASATVERKFRIGAARFFAEEWQSYVDGKHEPPPVQVTANTHMKEILGYDPDERVKNGD